jgi:predicted dehydrogenase
MKENMNRRNFIGTTAIGLAGVASTFSAKSYARVKGVNDRINIGFIGCGGRHNGHVNMVEMSYKDKNLGVVAVCDIWTHNRERAAANIKKRFGSDLKKFKYSEDMLLMPELDGVMIATGDHQHAKILAEVVKAGKDCYCEKPMAIDMDEAKLACEVVLNSKQVVQMGSQ